MLFNIILFISLQLKTNIKMANETREQSTTYQNFDRYRMSQFALGLLIYIFKLLEINFFVV